MTILQREASAGTLPVDIVETVDRAGGFGMLCRAWHASGLAEVLRHSGPYTVFAPTDAAFKRLPAGLYHEWIDAADPVRLLAILRHHVTPGRLELAELRHMGELRTMSGRPLHLRGDHSGIRIGDANLLRTDIAASNGLIHTVDQLL